MMKQWLERFFKGECFDAYRYFGAHLTQDGYVFRVYAPRAVSVRLVGTFNNWNGEHHVMNKIDCRGIYELLVPEVRSDYVMYRYQITTRRNKQLYKSDPYGFFSELRPQTASKTFHLDSYSFHDEIWMQKRTKCLNAPLNIYEMHLGSWMQKEDGSFLSYEEIIEPLIAYMKKMHFTHVEFLPLMETPLDMSWGYLVSSYFSINSRYGNPTQLKILVDKLHQNQIGVIMDFVPVHFIKDDFSLGRFDGTHVYESHALYRRHSPWGSYLFDYTKPEVMSFMLSCLHYYLNEFHIDGIRFDAISNMIYLHGDKNNGLNEPNINWMKKSNDLLARLFPSAMLIAEDSSDFQGVTKPVFEGGLGFDYKWDLGWMNDTLQYMKEDAYFRGDHVNKINFSMFYFYSERFLLPFSHDEVVHMKGSIINKIHGSYEQKFRQLKTLYMYMFMHPGKKLNFMGNELASFDEWNENKPLGFDLLHYPIHDSFRRYFKDLCVIYTSTPCLYKEEYNPSLFQWIQCDNKDNVFIFVRKYKKNHLITVLNFSGIRFDHYRFFVPAKNGAYAEILNSDQNIYNGDHFVNDYTIKIDSNQTIGIRIPAFGAILLKYIR